MKHSKKYEKEHRTVKIFLTDFCYIREGLRTNRSLRDNYHQKMKQKIN